MSEPAKVVLMTPEEIEAIFRRVVREELGTPAPPGAAPLAKPSTEEELAAARRRASKYGRGGAR